MATAFSFSANHFTKEDEERELGGLTEDEQMKVSDDMYGRGDNTRTNHTDASFGYYEAEIIRHARHNTENSADDNVDSNDTNVSDSEENEEYSRNFEDNEEEEQEQGGEYEDDDVNSDEDYYEEEEDILGEAFEAIRENALDDDTDDDLPGRLLDLFHFAITVIPSDESEEYWQVWTNAPELLQSESSPARFLRFEEYNPYNAAKSMCRYWKLRYKIFGEVDALKPMTLSGAMKSVIPYLVEIPTFFHILPDDDHGRTIICTDTANMNFKDYDDLVLVKIAWFVIHKALEKQSTQHNGVVLIIINQTMSWDFPSLHLLRMIANTFDFSTPIKIRCRHAITSSLITSLIWPIAKYVMPRDARLRSQVHSSINRSKTMNDLEGFGLRRDNLPKSIGGNYDEQPPWIYECERILERQKKKAAKNSHNN